MASSKTNPFKFGDPVEGEFYLPRPYLELTVRQFLENRIHIVLVGPRRLGKTSFIKDLISKFEHSPTICVYGDLFNVTSHRDFLYQLLRAIRQRKTLVQRFLDSARSISRLRPRLTTDIDPQTGNASFSLTSEVRSDEDVKEIIQDALPALDRLGDKVVLALDEFQSIATLEDDGWLEATLRTHMQQFKNTSLLLCGSRQSLIRDMLNDRSRPFYRSCQPIEFPVFGEEFTDWVIERFKTVGITCEKEAIALLRHEVQDTPNYVQMAGFHLVAQGVSHVNKARVEEVLRTIVKQNAYAYQTLLNSLTHHQQRVLRMAAIEGERIYGKDLLERYELSSAPAVTSAIKSLKQKQLLEEGTKHGRVVFDDPLFAIWLRMEFSF